MWKNWDENDIAAERESKAISAKRKITPNNTKEYHKAYKPYGYLVEETKDNQRRTTV